MPKISIIIPVYNVEKYLRQCLDSVVNQTLKDIEIICVNDGSTDHSLQILEEYAQYDHRIKVILQENQGVSIARNKGIKAATGEYIMFVDSDDWIEPETCQLSLMKLEENLHANICSFGINEIKNNSSNVREWEKSILEKQTLEFRDLSVLMVNACGKLFKSSFILKNKILFPEKIQTGEDSIFNLTCLFNNANYITLNKQLYNYFCDRKDSASNKLECAIKTDIEGFKYFFNQQIFYNAPEAYKIFAFEKFIGQLIYYYNRTEKYRFKYAYEIFLFYLYLRIKFPHSLLLKISNIGFLKSFSLMRNVFSVRNSDDRRHKVVILLWIKFKFERREKNVKS